MDMCIEYDGAQHFIAVDYWGGENGLYYRKLNDNIKNKYCKENNIKLFRIRFDQDIYIELKKIFKMEVYHG